LIATDGASALGADFESFTGCDHSGAANDAKAEDYKMKAAQIETPPVGRLSRAGHKCLDGVVVFISTTIRSKQAKDSPFLVFH